MDGLYRTTVKNDVTGGTDPIFHAHTAARSGIKG
jgi:hypothetical protein